MPPDTPHPVDPAEVTADVLRRQLDRIAHHLVNATYGLEQLGTALGLNPQSTENNIEINEK